MTRTLRWGLFAGGLAVTVVGGRWGLGLFTTAEYVHFSVNFPTLGAPPQLDQSVVGGPWTRLAAGEWEGYPAGGILPWGREGEVRVDLGQRGWLKRWLQPGTLLLSTHWLRNVGPEPRRVRLELDLCGFDVDWTTFERDWDPHRQRFTRDLLPGTTGNVDWIVHLPREARERRLVCRGELRVIDDTLGVRLTALPVVIENTAIEKDGA